MVLVAGSLGNVIKIFRNPWHMSCYCSAWTTVVYLRIFGMFSKIAVFFRFNLSVTRKLTVSIFWRQLVSPYFTRILIIFLRFAVMSFNYYEQLINV